MTDPSCDDDNRPALIPTVKSSMSANGGARGFAGALACIVALASFSVGGCATAGRFDPWRVEGRFGADLARRPLVVAHRGSSAAWPENTVPALSAGVREGADLHELDTFETEEGVPYLMHDRVLDRTTDADERLSRLEVPSAGASLEFLRTLDAGAWKGEAHRGVRVPTLEEALRALGPDQPAMIERKQGAPRPVLDVVRRLGRLELDVLQSFDWGWLAEARTLEPRAQLGALGSGPLDDDVLARLEALDVDFVHWKHADLDARAVAELHARGWIVGAYTIDDPTRLAELAAWDVDFLTTNQPQLLVAMQEGGAALRPAGSRP